MFYEVKMELTFFSTRNRQIRFMLIKKNGFFLSSWSSRNAIRAQQRP